MEEGRVLAAALYVTVSNVGGLALCYVGMRAGGP
jgi:fluoride ion exporter CrcB/FEX